MKAYKSTTMLRLVACQEHINKLRVRRNRLMRLLRTLVPPDEYHLLMLQIDEKEREVADRDEITYLENKAFREFVSRNGFNPELYLSPEDVQKLKLLLDYENKVFSIGEVRAKD
mgnify:CR=1 FL=1